MTRRSSPYSAVLFLTCQCPGRTPAEIAAGLTSVEKARFSRCLRLTREDIIVANIHQWIRELNLALPLPDGRAADDKAAIKRETVRRRQARQHAMRRARPLMRPASGKPPDLDSASWSPRQIFLLNLQTIFILAEAFGQGLSVQHAKRVAWQKIAAASAPPLSVRSTCAIASSDAARTAARPAQEAPAFLKA